ncbi:hypothetical protein BTURTLESOX_213 [bacterium endosymbiont of Bathymodiolus sp. 5 South]|nr:hypothetical protein BTURTLESOX_213 [bacterium endosymbiont of Bathymodiolus sp. 5 South]
MSFNVSDTRKCLTNFKNKVVLLKTSSTNISEAFRTSGFSLGVTLESGVKTRGFEELD